MNYMFVHLLDN